MLWKAVAVCVLGVLFRVQTSSAQGVAPASGEITVRITQAIDSAVLRPGQAVQGNVQSNSPEVPKGSLAFMTLLPGPGGTTLRLIRIQANGQLLNASSSAVKLAPGLFNKVNNARRAPGEPEVTAAGPHIYLRPNTDIVFTLAPAPPPPAPRPGAGQKIGRQAPPPPPPSRPEPTVVDLPPAAPGYPPLHASHAARQGCFWTPFVSQKFGFEAAVEKCDDPIMNLRVVEMADGLGLVYETKPPFKFVTVVTKPADQTIEAAIKQQYILKQKNATERTSCRVVKGLGVGAPDDNGVSKSNPSILTYSVQPYGPYAKLKKFQGDTAETPCPELHGNDTVGMIFQYNPSESKTTYLFFQTDENAEVFDDDSIHFLPQAEQPR